MSWKIVSCCSSSLCMLLFCNFSSGFSLAMEKKKKCRKVYLLILHINFNFPLILFPVKRKWLTHLSLLPSPLCAELQPELSRGVGPWRELGFSALVTGPARVKVRGTHLIFIKSLEVILEEQRKSVCSYIETKGAVWGMWANTNVTVESKSLKAVYF